MHFIKKREFTPDYRNIVDAANNIAPKRIPIYEHLISVDMMERVLNRKFGELYQGNDRDKREFFRSYIEFFKTVGYDTVSYECCIGAAMPGSGSLGSHKPGVIQNREDFDKYPWDSVHENYFSYFSRDFELLREELPSGMKAVGGPGNGVLELVEDVVSYNRLCYIKADDPELYEELFSKIGEIMQSVWKTFLEKFNDIYVVCRFGDDLGFKSSTLISPDDIRANIIPQYAKIVKLVHSYNKPFLLHSCGNTFGIMEDLINVAGIDAKHSNEDVIAPFKVWVDKYGDRIGNFGGVDLDVICLEDEQEIKRYSKDIIDYAFKHKGFAFGTGNSIPDYVPTEGYIAMIEAAREARGE